MKKVNIDRLDMLSFLNGLVFYAPVALLVRTDAGVTMAQFFVLQAVLSLTVFLFEIPTGMITDRIGYKSTMILAQITMFLARALLLAAFLSGSYPIFVAEAVVEGFAACFLSGTQDAYIYSVYKNEQCAVKMAHVANFGTTGFVLSTVLYVLLYHFGGIGMLIVATMAACGMGIPCVAGIRREPEPGEAKCTEASGDGRAGLLAVFADVRMILMVFLASGFALGFLLINFFYVDKLAACGLRAELMSPIIIAYSVIQMLAEKMLDRIGSARYRTAMLVSIICSGVVMLLLPLLLSFPEFILDNMLNAHIDRCGQAEQRATILSVANMVSNLMEIAFLFASAYIVSIGISACFASAGIMLVVFGIGVYAASPSSLTRQGGI